MLSNLLYSTYHSPLGEIILASNHTALVGLWFANQKNCPSIATNSEYSSNTPLFSKVKYWLDSYFAGEVPYTDIPISLNGTKFQIEVWKLLQTIPYGNTISYGSLAAALTTHNYIGRKVSPRSVGSAVSRNPISIIIPCHRVIGYNGNLVGYAGGLERKHYLLSLEQHSYIFK